ncbi:hypothetical protein BTUL_0157g00260 [Botrytis tulipae]|uniref:Uncharacterized protein n=1 Tax=Botrytis tulipae TaxID=87230 RepID=A0A4Z1EGT9_9HELO|nr:hypothetical protein BTUL_0157g00260 [Botrytis tulipae]
MDSPFVASNGSSNTATESPLCAISSAQLALDDADSGGALKNENGVSVLYFPYAGHSGPVDTTVSRLKNLLILGREELFMSER